LIISVTDVIDSNYKYGSVTKNIVVQKYWKYETLDTDNQLNIGIVKHCHGGAHLS